MHSYSFSLFTSSVILITTVLMSLLRWAQLYLYREDVSWKIIANLLVVSLTTIGLSISLLVCGLSTDEKYIVALLLLYGRLLIITQVRFAWKTLSVEAYEHASLILLGICNCCLGLTIFVVHQIIRWQIVETMIRIGVWSFAVESLGLVVAYGWIIFQLNLEVWYKQYPMLLALGVAGCGFLTAFVPILINVVRQVDWKLALWIHIGAANLWVGREIAIAILGLLKTWRRGRYNLEETR